MENQENNNGNTQALIGGGANIVSGLIGMIGAKKRATRQFNRQKELMEIQQKNQMALNQQGADLSYEQWQKTGYEAQRKQIEEAGLNVGLMYGQSGGGGQTANTGSGGGAVGGNAPYEEFIGIEATQAMAQMASIELMKAQAKKAEAEANNIAGVENENIKANTALTNMELENKKIENEIKARTIEDIVTTIGANRNKAIGEARTSMTNANINEDTFESQKKEIEAKAINEAFKLNVMKAGVNLDKAKVKEITTSLEQEWEKLYIELEKVGVSKMQNAINEFTAKVNAKLGQGNLDMRKLEAGIEATGKLLGNKKIEMNGERKTTINNY